MSLLVIAGLAVKSSLVALGGLACARLIGRGAVERVDILRGTVCLLLALPVVSALMPALTILLPAAAEAAPPPPPLWEGEMGRIGSVAVSGAVPWPSLDLMIVAAWLVGVAAVAGRLALGLKTLDAWTRAARPVRAAEWLSVVAREPAERRPQVLRSDQVAGPLSWGVSPGVVLVDPASLERAGAAGPILAHELAHLRRRDWLFLILSRLAVALFWFNPLVWRLHAELIARSEEAADAAAIERIDRHDYARALVRLASHPTGAATAMAADARTLKTRIACIMSDTRPSRRPLTVALTVVALAAVATPLAALEIRNRAEAVSLTPPAPPAPPTPPAPPAPPSAFAEIAPPAPPAPPPLAAFAPPTPPAPPAPPGPPAPPAPPQGSSYVFSYRTATPEQRQAREDARAQAEDARRQAAEARRQGMNARAQAEVARRQAVEARVQAQVQVNAMADVRIQAERARASADQARQAAEVAREQARVQMVDARVQMRHGAEEMRRGAQQMRAEADRLRDPAYRAEQIARNRARGHAVTDEELRALSPRLRSQADDLERQADQLASQAS